MKSSAIAALALLAVAAHADPRPRRDLQVFVPPAAFNDSGQRAQPCDRCCIYEDRNYTEGAVINVQGVLMQCQRDESALSTNPLVWRRVRP